jgi:hypothetical protein
MGILVFVSSVVVVLRPPLEMVLRRHAERLDKPQAIPDWVVTSGCRTIQLPGDDEFDVVASCQSAGNGRGFPLSD